MRQLSGIRVAALVLGVAMVLQTLASAVYVGAQFYAQLLRPASDAFGKIIWIYTVQAGLGALVQAALAVVLFRLASVLQGVKKQQTTSQLNWQAVLGSMRAYLLGTLIILALHLLSRLAIPIFIHLYGF